MREQIEAVKKANLGKKKFGFSRKPKKSSGSTQSALTEVQNTRPKEDMAQPHMASNTSHAEVQNSSGCSVPQHHQ